MWRLLSRGGIPISLAAQSLNKSLTELTLFPALANSSQRDPRRRSAVPAYSGARLPISLDITQTTVGVDATALLTLSYLNVLDKALDAFMAVYVPHSTLTWLFKEQHKATFHQPSRIRDAHKLRDLLAGDLLEKCVPSTVPDGDLAFQIGHELAGLIAEATKVREDDNTQRIVVRSSPVHRLSSLMEQEADLTAQASVMSSCLCVVNKLREKGCLGAQLAISVNHCPPLRDPRSRMTSFKRTQRKDVQKAYRVRNWREYETGLRARGSLTVWLGLTDGKLANWNSPRPTRRKPGRQRQYSNHAIETTVTLGLVFGLASRQTEGFLRSRLTLLNLDNDVPDHSTISRRKARLGKVASYERRTVKPVHLRIDSSGLSVHVGQLRTPPKARDYRKLHLAVDEHTSDVVACELTSKRARDASRVASLVGQIERPIASAKADAAYDTGDVYKTLENHRAHRSPTVLIPPRKGAQLALDSAGTRQRNRNIRARSRVGKRKWYVASGYSRRRKVETTFHRDKAILDSAMRARGLASQRVEVRLGCKILNTMTALGIPDGEMIG